jgi:hypothetical protein
MPSFSSDLFGDPISRRLLLQRGAAMSLAAMATGAVRPARGFAAASAPTLAYRGPQPTGWPRTVGRSFATTLGGHRDRLGFAFADRRYEIALEPFGRSGSAPDPVYAPVPSDGRRGFKRTLERAFADHYAFSYDGGVNPLAFEVQSYSVFVDEPTGQSPETHFGADLYVVYRPDARRGDPAIGDDLHWIQVVTREMPGLPPETLIDNLWRANPWYFYGGLTSINGSEVFNFHDVPQNGVAGAAPVIGSLRAEVFLARETGKTKRGKAVVDIFGGLKWGWQVEPA